MEKVYHISMSESVNQLKLDETPQIVLLNPLIQKSVMDVAKSSKTMTGSHPRTWCSSFMDGNATVMRVVRGSQANYNPPYTVCIIWLAYVCRERTYNLRTYTSPVSI